MHTPTFVRGGQRPGRRLLSSCGTAVLAGLLLLGSFAAQAQLAAPGTYTINPAGAAPGVAPYASGTNFQTFSQAVTALNATASPMAGAVTFNVANSAAFAEAGGVPAITVSGTLANPIIFQKVTFSPVNLATNPTVTRAAGGVGTTDTVIPISGGDFITFDGINATAGDATVEFGYLVRNASATNGAKNNTIKNAKIVMSGRLAATNSTVGVLQSSSASATAGSLGGGGVAPTSQLGANDNNIYDNLTVENGYRGISLFCGNIAAVFYDQNNVVRNCIVDGNPTGSPATSATTPSTGIMAQNQNNATVNGNTVRNIISAGSGSPNNAYGIFINEVTGTANYVYNNQVTAIRIVSATTSSTAQAIGMALDVDNSTAATGHRLTAYNNFVSDVTHNYSSTVATTLRAFGIATQTVLSGASNFINVYHNAVRLGAPAGTTATSAAFGSLTTTGPVLTVRNNIFANLGGAQTGAFKHAAFYSSSATVFGNTGSTSDFNDLYVTSPGTTDGGLVGLGATTGFYVTLANFQAAYPNYGTGNTVPIDNSSKTVDPVFTSTTDLHITSGTLNNVGQPGNPPSVVPPAFGFDIDNQARSATVPDIGADEFTPPANDVAVNSLTAPVSPTTSGSKTVTVSISNNGSAFLTSVVLQYTLNGGAAVSQTFTTANSGLNLAPGGTTTLSFSVGNNAVLVSGSNTFVVTGSLPNGAADATPGNNSVTTTVYTALSGPYTINSGAAASPTNYQSFTAAATALNQGGVSAAVTFTVSGGPYVEQVTLGVIAGASAGSPVVFNGGGSILRFGASVSGQQAVLTLNGADYVTVNNLVIDATNGGLVPTYGWGVFLTNAADNNTISNCTITTVPNQTSTFYSGIVVSGSNTTPTTAGNNANNLTLTGNTINNGYYSITLTGVALTPATGNTVSNNVINDPYFYGIYITGQDGAQLLGNDISRPLRTTVSTFNGIFFTGNSSNCRVERNRVHAPLTGITTSTSASYGIYFSSCDATPGNSNVVANNLIYDFNGAGVEYGFYNIGSDYVQYYHNTVSLDNTASTATTVSYGFYQTTMADGVEFRNNVVSVTRGGSGNRIALVYATTTSNITSNYNDLYVGGTPGTAPYFTGAYGSTTTTFGTLAQWQGAAGGIYDLNSVQANPGFTAGTLIPTSATLDMAGDATVGGPATPVTTDFANATRTSPPDLGAYQFTPPSADVSLTAFVAPVAPIGAGATPVTVTVQNNGATPLTSVTLSYTLNGGTAVMETITGLNIGAGLSGPVSFSAMNNATLLPGSNTLTVVATLPNGSVDPNPGGNTVTTTFSTALAAGTYTINSGAVNNIGSGGSNFQSFTEVAASLNSGGILGSVIFNVVASSGPYNEQFMLNAVAGSGSGATITVNGNGRTLTSGATTATAGGLGVINLNGTDYVTINNLVVNCTATVQGAGIRLTNQADNNTINGCTVSVDLSVTSSLFAAFAASGGTTVTAVGDAANNLTLTNNTFSGGYYCVSLYGASATSRSTGVVVTNNVVRDYYLAGLYVNNEENAQLIGNDMSRPTRTTVTTFYGIYLSGCQGADIERNRIHDPLTAIPTSTSACYGIYFPSTDAVSGNENDVVNNLIYNFNGAGIEYGIYSVGSDFARYYHNTISLDNTASTSASVSYGIYQTTAANGVEVRNNIVSVTRGGTGNRIALVYATNTSLITSNYNDLYVGLTPGTAPYYTGAFGSTTTTFGTLAQWQGANSSAYDQNSVQADPQFAAPATGGLQPANAAVNNLGDATVGGPATRVPTDFATVTRSATPDMGAFEFTPAATDLAPVALTAPATGQSCYGTAQVVTVTVRNRGTSAITFTPAAPGTVTVMVSGAAMTTLTASITSGTLNPGATQPVTLTAGGPNGNGTLNMSAAGAYTFNITATVFNDGNTTNDVLTPDPTITVVGPVAGTLAPATSTVCTSGTITLNLTGAANGNIQFQQSADNLTFVDVTTGTGGTTANYTTGALTQTTYFRAQTRCNSSVVNSNVSTISISNPQPSSTNSPLTACSGSSATLTVTGTTGQTFQFFANPSGGTALASTTGGTPSAPTGSYTTPALTANTTYYVETNGSNAATVGKTSNTGLTANTGANTGLVFDVAAATTLRQVTVYSVFATSQNVTIQLQNSAGTALNTLVVAVAPGATGAPVATVVTLNFPLSVGTNYRLLQTTGTSLVRESSTGFTYPYVASDNSVTITSSYTGGPSPSFYYYFYNWQLGSSCTGTRTPLQVNLAPPATLTGTVGGGTYCDATISGNVTLTGPLTVNGNLTVPAGATLNTNCQVISGGGNFTLAAGGNLIVCDANGITTTAVGSTAGPIQMTGTRSYSNDANYTYNGTVLQSTGDGLPARVRNLTVNNPAGVSLSQPVGVTQLVRLTNGSLASNGNLTLLSVRGSSVGTPTAGYTALIYNEGSGTVTGTATMQRAVDILTPENIGYHHYASPVANTTLADLAVPGTYGFTPVFNGAVYNAAAQVGTVRPFPTVFGYDQSRVGSPTLATDQVIGGNAFNQGFVAPIAGTDAMVPGQGYTANVPNDATVDFVGTFNNSPVATPVTFPGLSNLARNGHPNGGYQLVGNPFPSPIDAATMAPALTNMDNQLHVFHSDSRYGGAYSSYVIGSPAGSTAKLGEPTSTLIPAGTGFLMRVTAPNTSNGAVALTNANRVTAFALTPQPAFGRQASTTALLQLQVRGAGRTDALYLYTAAQATAGVDARYDATKLTNPNGLNLAALAGATPLAIDALPGFAATTVVPLTLGVPTVGTYVLDVTQLVNLGTTRAYLRDAVTGTETLLAQGTQVPVTLTNIATATTRFALVFRPSGALATAASLTAGQVSLYPNPAHASFTVLLPPVAGAKEVKATLLNALGQTVTTRTIALTAAGATAEFNTSSLAQGVYMLRLTAGNETLTQRVVVE